MAERFDGYGYFEILKEAMDYMLATGHPVARHLVRMGAAGFELWFKCANVTLCSMDRRIAYHLVRGENFAALSDSELKASGDSEGHPSIYKLSVVSRESQSPTLRQVDQLLEELQLYECCALTQDAQH
jgi:hypothetical protein